VDFCAKQFAATPVYSEIDLHRLSFASQFDLIWVGSLVTHLPAIAAGDARLPRQVTKEYGVIVFTTRAAMSQACSPAPQEHRGEYRQAALLEEYARTGFAYQRYFESSAEEDYGMALTSPEWLMRTLQRYPDVIMRAYLEEAWGMQDVVILYKKAGHFEPCSAYRNRTPAGRPPAARGLLGRFFGR